MLDTAHAVIDNYRPRIPIHPYPGVARRSPVGAVLQYAPTPKSTRK